MRALFVLLWCSLREKVSFSLKFTIVDTSPCQADTEVLACTFRDGSCRPRQLVPSSPPSLIDPVMLLLSALAFVMGLERRLRETLERGLRVSTSDRPCLMLSLKELQI